MNPHDWFGVPVGPGSAVITAPSKHARILMDGDAQAQANSSLIAGAHRGSPRRHWPRRLIPRFATRFTRTRPEMRLKLPVRPPEAAKVASCNTPCFRLTES
jgi:hypothetical protein